VVVLYIFIRFDIYRENYYIMQIFNKRDKNMYTWKYKPGEDFTLDILEFLKFRHDDEGCDNMIDEFTYNDDYICYVWERVSK
jgi:hypothetical protein